MNSVINALVWILRLVFLINLIQGLVLWSGHGYAYLSLHMCLGFLITFALLGLAIIGFVNRAGAALSLVSLVWAVLLPFIGIAQLRLLPGPNHWIIRVVSLRIGLGGMGRGESLAKRSRRPEPIV